MAGKNKRGNEGAMALKHHREINVEYGKRPDAVARLQGLYEEIDTELADEIVRNELGKVEENNNRTKKEQ